MIPETFNVDKFVTDAKIGLNLAKRYNRFEKRALDLEIELDYYFNNIQTIVKNNKEVYDRFLVNDLVSIKNEILEFLVNVFEYMKKV